MVIYWACCGLSSVSVTNFFFFFQILVQIFFLGFFFFFWLESRTNNFFFFFKFEGVPDTNFIYIYIYIILMIIYNFFFKLRVFLGTPWVVCGVATDNHSQLLPKTYISQKPPHKSSSTQPHYHWPTKPTERFNWNKNICIRKTKIKIKWGKQNQK